MFCPNNSNKEDVDERLSTENQKEQAGLHFQRKESCVSGSKDRMREALKALVAGKDASSSKVQGNKGPR